MLGEKIKPEFTYLVDHLSENGNYGTQGPIDQELRGAKKQISYYNMKINHVVEDHEDKVKNKYDEVQEHYDPFNEDRVIFMGSGNISEYKCNKAHEYLDKAFSIISGLQQGGEPYPGADMDEVKRIYERLGKCLGL